jgi:hypothetical protein
MYWLFWLAGYVQSRRRMVLATLISVAVLGELTVALTAQSQGPALAVDVLYPDPMLAGTIDMHSHSGPDSRPRAYNHLELARLAKRAGIRAIVLKQHYTESASTAQLIGQEVPGIEVFGAIVLNLPTGGINPDSVRNMLAVEGNRGRVVWLPTWDAENDANRKKENRPGVPIVKDGKLVPGLADIFKLIADNNLVLATGHSSPDESLIVLAAARQAGVRRLVVTHPWELGTTPAQMKRLADLGAFLECTKSDVDRNGVDECAKIIKAVGAEHVVFGSDAGQRGGPVLPLAMKQFMMRLQADGISQAQIDLLVRKNPAALLGLSPS